MIRTPNATHRGAPFSGRRREIGILAHLLDEGLAGTLSLIRVSGETGIGRRRLIAEALKHGPDAEWIHLAPGGVEQDLPRWIRTELFDLLDSYPETPEPSWALHALSPWARELRRRAAVPALSRERIPADTGPEIVGSAVGALLNALTGRTLIVVDAGLWPRPRSSGDRMLRALAAALRGPGAVMLAACPSQEAWDPEGVRTVKLEPLRLEDIEELCTAWTGDADTHRLAAFLARITGGHPFFLHETIRWLEELGHVRVEEDAKRVDFLDPIGRLPIPLFLRTVMDSRYHRLSPSAAHLLRLLSRFDGKCEPETLRDLSGFSDDAFDDALAALRRRGFLLRRTSRHPLALASPLWRKVVREAPVPVPRRARPPSPCGGDRTSPRPVLAASVAELNAIRTAKIGPETTAWSRGLARIYRLSRFRPGPAWAGVRGRLAVLAARGRLEEGRMASARRWIRWGRTQLAPARHPAMRRELWRLRAVIAEREGQHGDAEAAREAARAEALDAGHLRSAARLLAVVSEQNRRQGRLEPAHADAARAARDLAAMGLTAWAERAGYTAVAARIDARKLEAARRDRETLPLSEAARKEIQERLIHLTQDPPVSLSPVPPLEGWGWGLDESTGWCRAQRDLSALGSRWNRNGASDMEAGLGTLDSELAGRGYGVARADLAEIALVLAPPGVSPREVERRMEIAVARNRELGCPERNRFLARTLRTVHGAHPAFPRLLSRDLLESVPAKADPPAVRWHLLGRPRVATPSREWPMALWPEWWLALWTEVLAVTLSGDRLSCEEAERLVRNAGDAPSGDLDAVLHEGNQKLQNGGHGMGGIERHGTAIHMGWGRLWCDVREILDALAGTEAGVQAGVQAGTQAGAQAGTGRDREIRDRVLTLAAGPLLPGMEGERIGRLRRRIRSGLEAVLRERLDRPERIAPDQRVRWLEGLSLVLGPESPAIALMARTRPPASP